MTARNSEYLNLDVGMGLVVQLTSAEAKELIPKLKSLLLEKLESAKKDLEKAHKSRKTFEENFLRLKLALDPVVSRLDI